jgi:hypothetical protein
MRLALASVFVAIAAAGSAAYFQVAAARTAASPGPPRGLTPYGRLTWNLDALVNDTFGHRRPCFDEQSNNVFSVPQSRSCPAPLARYADYTFTFLNAFHSSYRLVKRSNPWAGTNVAPFSVARRYVYCGGGRWLGFFHGGGLWPLSCQRP